MDELTDNSPMPFGKQHLGKPMSEVPADYLLYLYDQGFCRNAQVLQYVEDNLDVLNKQAGKNIQKKQK